MGNQTAEYDRGNFYSLEVELGLTWGLCLRSASVFVRECRNASREVYLEKVDDSGQRASGKNILQVLCLGAECGKRLRIYVEGSDKESQGIAERICKGLSQTGTISPNFD